MPFVKILPSKIHSIWALFRALMSHASYVSKYVFQGKRYTTKVAASLAYTGPLSETIPSSCIEVVNSVVEPIVETEASDECSSSAKDKGKSVRGA